MQNLTANSGIIHIAEYFENIIIYYQLLAHLRNCIDVKLVEKVDNYALLNMDIIWCYLNLQNLHELKNAGTFCHLNVECYILLKNYIF